MATSLNNPIPPEPPTPHVSPPPGPPPEVLLRRLNFEDNQAILHILPAPAVDNYTFTEYEQNGRRHYNIRGYCVSCEAGGVNVSPDHPTFSLQTISHGAHSSDFFRACGHPPDETWKSAPVMFVYESPGTWHNFYDEVSFCGHRKWPTWEWYWIHRPQHFPSPPTGCPPTGHPAYFQGGRRNGYGRFVLSVMFTFKLANVYVTNLVKCGLNDPSRDYLPLTSPRSQTANFNCACVRNCYDTFLKKELDILNPRIIFAVGAAGAAWLRVLLGNTWVIQSLPHPVRPLSSQYFQVLNYWLVLNGLRAVGIVDQTEYAHFAELFFTCFGAEGPGRVVMPPP
jgi:hypothetical protein